MSSYANPTDLTNLALPAAALNGISTPEQQAALDSASETVDSYLRQRFVMPLSRVGLDVIEAVCSIAAWRLMKKRGFNPEDPSALAVRQGYKDAIAWLSSIARGDVKPDVTDSSNPADTADLGTFVLQPYTESTTIEQDGEFVFQPGGAAGPPSSRGW